eukprot:g4323.t1
MDPLAQAFAYYNYEFDSEADPDAESGQISYNDIGDIDLETGTRVTAKHHFNSATFPYGFVIPDDSWDNYWREGQNQSLGWSPGLDGFGNGAKSLGEELANTEAFAACQVEKAFEAVCLREPGDEDDRNEVESLVSEFQTDYNMKQVEEGHNCWEAADSACASIITNYIEAWGSESGSVSNVIVLVAPEDPDRDPGATKSFPEDTALFEEHVYDDILAVYCSTCHSDTSDAQQQPFFASANVDLAYENAQSRMDLETAANSRFVIKLSEGHNCWNGSCASSMAEMQAAIAAFSGEIEVTEVDEDLVTSKAISLPEGVVASSGGRVETNVIALYEFKEGEGSVAFDTSGVDPAANLNLFDDVDWVGSWGIRINNGQARATTASSRKFYDNIALGTGEYSIEAWVVPANVSQEGPARIISYSGGDEIRNFTLGQTLYNYNFLSRSSLTDANAMPFVSTPDADEVLQATLQHVVTVYDPIEGRSIYVNGELVSETDPVAGGTLTDWDDSYAFVVGNETSGNYLWQGTVRLLAVYNRAMTEEDILANYDAGVGEKYFLLFNISDIVDVADAYIVFEVQQFDDYSYLFNTPFFYLLNGDPATVGPIPLEGMRIGINGKEAAQGQAYSKLITDIDGTEYGELGQILSPVGTVVALENGPDIDEFFLTFDLLGAESFVRTDSTLFSEVDPADIEQSAIGIKTFEEIDATLSAITTVPRTNASVASTFATVKQQMPTSPAIDGFLSAHQMGVTQLAVEYCNELTSDTSLRSNYFSGFDFGLAEGSAFADTGLIIDPLVEHLLAHQISGDQPDEAPDLVEVEGELDSLFANPQQAYADLSGDLEALRIPCGITDGAGKIPFICFDLAGGVNTAGSNVLVGQAGGQEDFLSTAGYSKQGLPGDMVPQAANPDDPLANTFVDDRLGLLFHSDSQMLEGITEKTTTAIGNINGAVVAARSENDTDTNIVGPGGIFSTEEYNGDSEFRKTAAIMKLVMNGHAGAGTVTMGGYDYHTGDRATGEVRDLRAGRCIGACLEYAARLGKPLMVYVFSDGSVFSNGMTDDSELGRGKGVWTGDNQQTAAPFFLVYNPNGQPAVVNQQIGYMRASGDVETTSSPVANNVNLLVEAIALNYMALHGDSFDTVFTDHSLGNDLDSLTAFEPIVSGTIPVT